MAPSNKTKTIPSNGFKNVAEESEKPNYSCSFCGESFNRKDRFDRHLFTHTNEVCNVYVEIYSSLFIAYVFRKFFVATSMDARSNTQTIPTWIGTKSQLMKRNLSWPQSTVSIQIATNNSLIEVTWTGTIKHITPIFCRIRVMIAVRNSDGSFSWRSMRFKNIRESTLTLVYNAKKDSSTCSHFRDILLLTNQKILVLTARRFSPNGLNLLNIVAVFTRMYLALSVIFVIRISLESQI